MDISKKPAAQLPKPFYVLSQALNLSNRDHAKWWHSTAPMFATMMAGAGYGIHTQYKFLCIHREIIIPALDDPFNTQAIRPVLQDMKAMVPGLDLKWFDQFTKELVVSDKEIQTLRDANTEIPVLKTQNKLAADLGPSGDIVLKTYIYPRIKSIATGTSKETLMFDAIKAIDKGGKLATPLATLEQR
ncbi:tryptophan dimethylallyltransferase-domain-containing protein [Aspergillus foveolatus]|uniref:tryptophan dimethylallyltransferase-domain-containing protein n=1 Tax=Aspergillus foveolatus TaxID=210207 RepID=UPI003CCE1D4E